MGVPDTDVTDRSSSIGDMRAYTDRSDLQRSYPWQREKRDELSRSWGGERWNKADYNGDNTRLMNGPTTPRSSCKKYISVVSEGNYFIASKAPLPDRIELRMCGTSGLNKNNRSLSIPDLYRVKMKPIPEAVEETVDAMRSEEVQLEGSCPLHNHSPRNGSVKEMYVSQYTHHFDSDGPGSHIAGWKVDIEPNGIPHRRSRMCVLNNPVVSGERKRPERPKSAPPKLAYEEDTFADNIEDDRLSSATLPVFRQEYSEPLQITDDLSTRLQELIMDPPTPEYTNDDSSIGYDPSDDASETSSAYNQSFYKKRDPFKFNYSRPKLIRLSADFPGVRNLEKMRRKRQSMGSSSTGSMSSLSPSPSGAGEYGFFVALTSKDAASQQRRGKYYSMT